MASDFVDLLADEKDVFVWEHQDEGNNLEEARAHTAALMQDFSAAIDGLLQPVSEIATGGHADLILQQADAEAGLGSLVQADAGEEADDGLAAIIAVYEKFAREGDHGTPDAPIVIAPPPDCDLPPAPIDEGMCYLQVITQGPDGKWYTDTSLRQEIPDFGNDQAPVIGGCPINPEGLSPGDAAAAMQAYLDFIHKGPQLVVETPDFVFLG